jgi:organic hydroperoxide reductase OsmC/OhrA
MATTITYHSIPDTEAAIGVAGRHSVVADRPEGVAGGQGLGFNGGQLLALALGGCFANDLRAIAHERGVKLGRLSITVTLEFGGTPRVVQSARMVPVCETLDGSDPQALIDRAREISVIRNSVQAGFEVALG